MAKKLYEVVNCQTGCCVDCPYRHLSKMERMYLHRILKDQSRWQYETRTFVSWMNKKLENISVFDEEDDDIQDSKWSMEYRR